MIAGIKKIKPGLYSIMALSEQGYPLCSYNGIKIYIDNELLTNDFDESYIRVHMVKYSREKSEVHVYTAKSIKP